MALDLVYGIHFLLAFCGAATVLLLFRSLLLFFCKLALHISISPKRLWLITIAAAAATLLFTLRNPLWLHTYYPERNVFLFLTTTAIFYAGLQWQYYAGDGGDRRTAGKWQVFMFFILGFNCSWLNLAITAVHLFIYYLAKNRNIKGALWLLLPFFSIYILPFLQKEAPQFISPAFHPEKFFFRRFWPGETANAATAMLLIILVTAAALFFSARAKPVALKIAFGCLAFLALPAVAYITFLLRTPPGIDMYNVDSPLQLKGYLKQETYGDMPMKIYDSIPTYNVDNEATLQQYMGRESDAPVMLQFEQQEPPPAKTPGPFPFMQAPNR
jgi:hypothetical protein